MKTGKWIGGSLGWAFFGPLGGVLGFAFGALLDTDEDDKVKVRKTTESDFLVSLTVLIAAVIKVDGKVLKSELNYVKEFLVSNFGKSKASESLKLLKEALSQDLPVYDVLLQIKQNLDYSSRLQLMHFLFGLATADGAIHSSEKEIIHTISTGLGISQKDYESVQAMFYVSDNSAYKILEIDENVTDEEVKTAYRNLAKKHHPDRVSYLGEDVQKDAKEKFQKINKAYEMIKKERGIV